MFTPQAVSIPAIVTLIWNPDLPMYTPGQDELSHGDHILRDISDMCNNNG